MSQSQPALVSRRAVPATLFLTIGFLSMASPLATDMYLSGLPVMQRDLGTSATSIQFTLSAFMIGMAFGQLVWGPLSDSAGRRTPLLIGLALFVATGIAAPLSPSVSVLIALRFVQGFGGASGLVIGRAIARDLASGIELARILSMVGVVIGIAPIASPVLGGLLIGVIGWRGILWIVALLGVAMAVCAYFLLPETLPRAARTVGGIRAQASSLRTVITDLPFLGYTISAIFGFGAVFAYISSSSVVLQDIYGLNSVQFALCFGVNAAGMMVAGFVNSRLVSRVPPGRMLGIAQLVMVTGAAVLTVASAVLGRLPLAALVPVVLVTTAVNPLIIANTNTLALTRHGRGAGMASALLGCLQFVVGAAVAPLVTIGGRLDVLTMAVVMLVCALVGASGSILYRVRRFDRRLSPGDAGDFPS